MNYRRQRRWCLHWLRESRRGLRRSRWRSTRRRTTRALTKCGDIADSIKKSTQVVHNLEKKPHHQEETVGQQIKQLTDPIEALEKKHQGPLTAGDRGTFVTRGLPKDTKPAGIKDVITQTLESYSDWRATKVRTPFRLTNMGKVRATEGAAQPRALARHFRGALPEAAARNEFLGCPGAHA